MFSLCFIVLCSVYCKTSLCLVELYRTEDGLLPAPALYGCTCDPELPWLFGDTIPCPPLLAVVVVIVKMDGLAITAGLLFTGLM